ncbi:hypothetical protein ZOSMA_71G00180 [Zostera marina]|uniref:Uncharacterized protein n=1 Tax=Zostera marina TaxID=29655 RepID=A0A0K9NQ81_ZOSMR|nr:hypothetical protein ZOSMA_71G00180 [Zostera marina]
MKRADIINTPGPGGRIIRITGDLPSFPLLSGQGNNLVLELGVRKVDHIPLMPHALHKASVKFGSPLLLQLFGALQEIGLGINNGFLGRVPLDLELFPLGLELVPLCLPQFQLGLACIPLDLELIPLSCNDCHCDVCESTWSGTPPPDPGRPGRHHEHELSRAAPVRRPCSGRPGSRPPLSGRCRRLHSADRTQCRAPSNG